MIESENINHTFHDDIKKLEKNLTPVESLKSGAELLVQSFLEEDIEYIFGYPGGAVLPLYDTFYDEHIPHILYRHEQGATHAAEGYARVSGKPGVVVVTSGPGATNAITGIADALYL